MNNAASLPYHLRVNKAIDRNLFVDLLKYVGKQFDFNNYVYIGMGGPFLEDFKLLHSNFIFKNMISIDSDDKTVERQLFNRPFSCMDIRKESSGSFIATYDFPDPTIIWLDYTSFKIYDQLNEILSLVSNLYHGDLVKITLNANVDNLDNEIEDHCDICKFLEMPAEKKCEARLKAFKNKMNEFAPSTLGKDDFTSLHFSTCLLRCLYTACERGLEGKDNLCFQPLSAFDYADGQRMLSACGMILDKSKRDEFIGKTKIDSWSEKSLSWEDVLSINVPDLSAKERLAIESDLPGTMINQIMDKFSFCVPGNEREAKCKMCNFMRYYRQYPHYSRVLY